MSDTPLTDAEAFLADEHCLGFEIVSADVCRNLERQLNAAKAELAEARNKTLEEVSAKLTSYGFIGVDAFIASIKNKLLDAMKDKA